MSSDENTNSTANQEQQTRYSFIRQGDLSDQDFKASRLQAVVLSAWHTLHAFGILSKSDFAGETNLNV